MFFNIFKYKNTIISKYLLQSLLTYFIAIFLVISLLVFGNQFVLTVQESVEFGIPFKELTPLVGFNMLRDTPIILTLSLFLSIIITISQLYKNSEAVILNSIGLNDKNFIRLIQPIVLAAFVIIFCMTLFAVPWAKYEKSIAEDATVNASEFSFISEGKFESFKEGDIVFYASESDQLKSDSSEQVMEEIFIYADSDSKPIIVLASEAIKFTDSNTKSTFLRLKDGTRYEGLPGKQNVSILEFLQYDIEIVSGEAQKALISFSEIEEQSSIDLLIKGGLLANAEIQWRLSQPISLLILSVFGVFLGKSSPRTGKGVSLLIGVILFVLYNNSLLVAKSSIENGILSPIIGLWIVHFFLFLILLIYYQHREGRLSRFVDKIPFFNH